MSKKWLVLKFGGSSVCGLDPWRSIAQRIETRLGQGYRVLLVCSAVKGVTDLLHELCASPGNPDLIERFKIIHQKLAAELGVDGDHWIGKAANSLKRLSHELASAPSPDITAQLLGNGEWLSTRLGWIYLQKQFATEWVDARGLLESSPQDGQSDRRKWLSAECEVGFSDLLLLGLNGCESVVITQGYVIGMAGGGTALLGRGGSDTSAVLLGGRIGAERVEIWTDVPGLFSADPRKIPGARLLQKLEYAEALEMAASGASVVQSRAVRAAASTNTTIWIRDSAHPDIGGTQINGQTNPVEGARAVVCQQGMAVMLLQNVDPRQQVGFLAWVFDVIAGRGISIDLVATSETTTTIAINRDVNHMDEADLKALADDLRARCKVEVFSDCVTVNIVGRGVRTALSRLQEVFTVFEQMPLLMVSQSANDLCLSLLVQHVDGEALARLAHQALIPNQSDDSLFGPCWAQL